MHSLYILSRSVVFKASVLRYFIMNVGEKIPLIIS